MAARPTRLPPRQPKPSQALLCQAITVAATALVAYRVVDQETADSITGPAGDYVLGVGLAVGSAGWSVFRAWLMHTRWVQAWVAPAKPLPATPAVSV